MKIKKSIKIILFTMTVTLSSFLTTGCSYIGNGQPNVAPATTEKIMKASINDITDKAKTITNEVSNEVKNQKNNLQKLQDTAKTVTNTTQQINQLNKIKNIKNVALKTILANKLVKAKPIATKPFKVEILNNNTPYNIEQIKSLKPVSFEHYSKLDRLNRVGKATAILSTDTLPTEKRQSIGMVKPSGWHLYRFDHIIKDKYLYNRCHLIAHELAGENANPKNLMTGTRALNVDGMLPYENKVRKYIDRTKNHVFYRVTPHFEGQNLVADYITMEAYSLEDNGKGIKFNIKLQNTQPGVKIDYKTGKAALL